jgi:hypothetical protein
LLRHLKGTFERLLVQPGKRDPGCVGKLAVLDALDHLEDHDDAPFLLGAHYVQREPAFGGPVDGGDRAEPVPSSTPSASPEVSAEEGAWG